MARKTRATLTVGYPRDRGDRAVTRGESKVDYTRVFFPLRVPTPTSRQLCSNDGAATGTAQLTAKPLKLSSPLSRVIASPLEEVPARALNGFNALRIRLR